MRCYFMRPIYVSTIVPCHSRHDAKFFNFLYFHKNLDQDHKNNILFEINSHQEILLPSIISIIQPYFHLQIVTKTLHIVC